MAVLPRPLRRVLRLHEFVRHGSLVDHPMCFRRQARTPEFVQGNARKHVELGPGDFRGNDGFLIADWLLAT